ncbi:chemotaxis protein [Pseudomonas chlororaphis]|uniref:Chemotaxis protein n=1 Tax=Pseudomonas chlororaphis TaxID=587753 RepID=A0A0A6FI15_9PSED|nr:chemotaxis protein [Pseudomonas chlororaphis]
MILEVAVIVLFLFWAGTLAMFVSYIKAQKVIAAQQAQGDALRDQRIKDLAKRVDDYQNGNVRMGEALHELRAVVGPLPDKIVQLEQRDPSSLSFAQAAKLVGMGASVDELTQSCGLTQAEAELMRKLHKN